MSRQTMTFGAILCLVAMLSFMAWPLWQWMWMKKVDAQQQQRIEQLVAAHPELKPALNIAMMDGVLTTDEANEIEKADHGHSH